MVPSTHRLARFLAQQVRKLFLVVLVQFDELLQQLLPLVHRCSGPFWECLLRSLDGVVHVILARDGNVPELFAGSWIDALVGCVATPLLAIYDVVEGGEINVGGF